MPVLPRSGRGAGNSSSTPVFGYGHPVGGLVTLSDFRLAVLAARPHFECLQRTCRAVDVSKENWGAGREVHPPHLLLIEAGGLRRHRGGTGPIADEKVERAQELIAWCESENVPTALWETSLQRRIDTPTTLMARVGRVFVADPDATAPLAEELGGQRPAQLPLAAQVVPDASPGFDEREIEIAFLGHWAAWFKGPQREQLEMILEVARQHGLVVFHREEAREDYQLPDSLSPFLRTVPTDRNATEQFRNSRLVIAHDPRNHGRLMIPQVTFDALASGAVVIAPNNLGMRRVVGHIVLRLETRDEAEKEIEGMLGDGKEWAKQSKRSRTATLNAHTYANRVATIASAAGYRLLPEPERAYAFADA